VEVQLYPFSTPDLHRCKPRPDRKERVYPLRRKLGGLRARSGRARKVSSPPRFELRPFKPVSAVSNTGAVKGKSTNEMQLCFSKSYYCPVVATETQKVTRIKYGCVWVYWINYMEEQQNSIACTKTTTKIMVEIRDELHKLAIMEKATTWQEIFQRWNITKIL
jgi:hypothetical protein